MNEWYSSQLHVSQSLYPIHNCRGLASLNMYGVLRGHWKLSDQNSGDLLLVCELDMIAIWSFGFWMLIRPKQ